LATRESEQTLAKKKLPSNKRSPDLWGDVLAEFENFLFRTGSESTVATYGSALRTFGRYWLDENIV
jgi:hypothetical protein